MLYIEAVKLIIFNVDFLKSKENLALKTITKQINAIQEGIALTMKSWEVQARGVSFNCTKAV